MFGYNAETIYFCNVFNKIIKVVKPSLKNPQRQAIQNEILDILESNRKEELIKSSKIKQARMIVSLRNKYTSTVTRKV